MRTDPRRHTVRITCRVCDPPSTITVPAPDADVVWARHYRETHGNTTSPTQMDRLRAEQNVRPPTDPRR